MNLNRRDALKLTTALAVSPLLAGCPASVIEAEISVVLQEAVNVLAVIEPGASWLSGLQGGINALQTAESMWQSGGTVQVVIDALNTILAVTSAIPLTEQYSPLIDVLVAAIEAVMIALPPAPITATPAISVRTRAAAVNNPHVGRATIKRHFMRSPAYDFKAAWNETAKSSGLPVAVIK